MKRFLAAVLFMFISIFAIPAHARETDRRLHSGGGAWGFKKATSEEIKPLRILLIGDSVMNGYRHGVAEKLADIAACDVWLTPAHLNSPGLCEELGQIVRGDNYDLIHFNIGLHGWPEGRIPEGQYEPLLRQYVDTLKKNAPNADLIWASTTPIMTPEKPRAFDPVNNPTIVERNAIAEAVMTEKKIAIHDLYAVMSDKLNLGTDKFHWSAEGQRLQAESVVGFIRRHWNAESPAYRWPETFAYKSVGGHPLLLDVYKPDSKTLTPVFIIVHGGGWVSGRRNRGSERMVGRQLSDAGIAVVSVDYRLLDGDTSDITTGTFDRVMEDLADAYAWVKKNAETHNFDLDRVGIGGGSAGGHLSAIFAMQHEDIGYYVGICGQYDLCDIGQSRFASVRHQEKYGIQGPADQKRASAIHHIRKNPPVTLLMHGTADDIIDYRQAVRFGNALEANGGRVTLELFEGLGHDFFSTSRGTDHSAPDVMTRFLSEQMR